MKKTIKATPKRRGRPATGKDPQINMRMPAELISRIEDWAKVNELGRSEAIRRLVELGLKAKGQPSKG
jgi:hypothetical protein